MTVFAAPNPWRLVLCDIYGNPLSILTNIASDVEFLFRLNRPAQLTFTVPSESPQVNLLYRSSGLPWLMAGRRIVKAYRRVDPNDPSAGWDLRFVGRVWNLEDDGDGDTCRTAVTVYDPLYDLTARLVRDGQGNFGKQVNFWAVPGDQIIKKMIDRTNNTALGTHPPLRQTFITTDYTFEATTEQTASFDQAFIWPSIMALCDTGTVDLLPHYLDYTDIDFSEGFNAITHMALGAAARRGVDNHRQIIGYAGPPRNATAFKRTQTMDTFANDITGWGKSIHGHKLHTSDSSGSLDIYGAFEDAFVMPEIERQEFVEALVSEQLQLRAVGPRDLVSFEPQPETFRPFAGGYGDNIVLGDTCVVNAGVAADMPGKGIGNPVTRQLVEGEQRIYGFRMTVDDDYDERVTELIVSADAEGS